MQWGLSLNGTLNSAARDVKIPERHVFLLLKWCSEMNTSIEKKNKSCENFVTNMSVGREHCHAEHWK